MSEPRSLVVFAEDWGRHPSSTQHLVARLSATRDVIWINSIGLRRPSLSQADFRRVCDKLVAMVAPDTSQAGTAMSVPERLSILQPRAISWPGSAIAEAFNRRSLGRQIRSELARRKVSRPILWTSVPTAAPVIGEIGESALVYYCGDDFAGLAGVDHAPVLRNEAKIVDRANLILASSRTLAARFPSCKTALVPHGVDLTLFQRPVPRPAELPDGDRIAGFYGSLASWIDVEAIGRTALAMPDWTFLLIGPVRTDLGALSQMPNIRLLGEKPHGELAAYVQHWTVSLLPFRDNLQIRACNPLKLREYLAVGRPIVSPEFDALLPYRALIETVAYGSDYRHAILRAADDQARNAARRAIVERETWEACADRISEALERC